MSKEKMSAHERRLRAFNPWDGLRAIVSDNFKDIADGTIKLYSGMRQILTALLVFAVLPFVTVLGFTLFFIRKIRWHWEDRSDESRRTNDF